MSLIRTAAARLRRDHGQTLVTFVFFLIVLVLFVGLVIDVGFAYVTRASLSKAVDAACLTGARNLSSGQSQAEELAKAAFSANYPQSGRDVAKPDLQVKFSEDANNNTLINVSAKTTISTFFIRILPQWKSLTVSSTGQAVRTKVVMMLVLDRSGSMLPVPTGNDGSAKLPQAVSDFIDQFSDETDEAGVSSFGSYATQDVLLEQPFKDDVKNAVKNWPSRCGGRTFAEGGLNFAQSAFASEPAVSGAAVARVVVFFTDGYANTFQDNRNFTSCFGSQPVNFGASDGSVEVPPNYRGSFVDPVTGQTLKIGSTSCLSLNLDTMLPPCCPVTTFISIQGGSKDVNWTNVWTEGRLHALHTAELLRTDRDHPATIYAIGLGNALDRDFLKEVANDPSGANFDPHQPEGVAVFAATAEDLNAVFQSIASKILLRLTH
jgi:Flp pilus assembly protein TadG